MHFPIGSTIRLNYRSSIYLVMLMFHTHQIEYHFLLFRRGLPEAIYVPYSIYQGTASSYRLSRFFRSINMVIPLRLSHMMSQYHGSPCFCGKVGKYAGNKATV